jgi:hypothetical protein
VRVCGSAIRVSDHTVVHFGWHKPVRRSRRVDSGA